MPRLDNLDATTPVTTLAADALNHAAAQSGDAIRQLASRAGDLSHRSVEEWRGQARAWRDGTSEHIRANPLRSVLLATGVGVVFALLVRAFRR